MSQMLSRIRFGAGAAASMLIVAGCMGGSASPTASIAPSAGAGSTVSPGSTAGLAAGTRLVVLAENADGVVALWDLESGAAWKQLGTAPGATAIGTGTDGIAIATGHTLDLRGKAALSNAGTAMTLKWSGSEPSAPVVSLNTSPAGTLAVVTSDAQSLGYGIVSPGGTVKAVTPAPAQSFTPSVAWLDESRLLVLSTDTMQLSHLAAVDTTAGTLVSGGAVSGVRVAGLSTDRSTAAVATESGLYIGSVASLLGQTAVPLAITLEASQIAWALALDADGSHLFVLSGTMAADGKVGSVRELGYAKQGSGWVKVLDSPVPFGRAIGQVYLA